MLQYLGTITCLFIRQVYSLYNLKRINLNALLFIFREIGRIGFGFLYSLNFTGILRHISITTIHPEKKLSFKDVE